MTFTVTLCLVTQSLGKQCNKYPWNKIDELIFRYILRVFGLTGAETRAEWTPPSCVLTTPAPTTTKEPEERRDEASDNLYDVLEENDQLKAKIEGLNEEYAKIGLEVFNAFSSDAFAGVEKLIAIRHEIKANESASDY